tara:strand:+ start:101 stop:211 length:111 start_codon:yes stop_codon:yes gene_type:complete
MLSRANTTERAGRGMEKQESRERIAALLFNEKGSGA